MRIEDLKRWHWCILGILGGLALAYTWSNIEELDVGRTTSQRNFERALLLRNPAGDPQIKNIVVHPAQRSELGEMVSLVTFDWLTLKTLPKDTPPATQPVAISADRLEYIKHNLIAPIPYEPTPLSGLAAEQRATPGGTIEAGDRFQIIVTSPGGSSATLEYTATGSSVESVTAGLVAEWKKSFSPLLKLMSVTDEKTHVKLAVSDIAGNLTVTQATLEKDGTKPDGQTFNLGSGVQNVMQFLDKMSQQHQGISYRYAWYYQPKWMYTLGAMGGLVIVGGIWPTLLNLMVGAGFGRAPREKDEYDLNRFKGESASSATASVAGSVDDAKLDALNAKLEKSLAGSAGVQAARSAGTEEEEIRKLDAAPAEPPATVVAEKPQEDKDYRGEFYPTAKGKKKD